MDDGDIEALLDTNEWGVLAMADGGKPYTIPITFGYDGADIYFVFVSDGPTNTKFEFLADGQPAHLLVTDVRAPEDWRSVAVSGCVEAINRGGDGWDELLDVLDDNAWFSPDFSRAEATTGLQGWRLEAEEVHGRSVDG